MNPITRMPPSLIAMLALLLANALTLAPAQAADTLVVLVRHAEKAAEPGPDPALDAAGQLRARAIADRLAHAGIDAIYVTSLQRTALTAAPLAERLDVRPEVFWPDADGHQAAAQALAGRIREQHVGSAVLVVGHSNTLPLIVEALTGVAVDEIDESDYGNMFVVTLDAQGRTRLVPTRL